MKRAFYSDSIVNFLNSSQSDITGKLAEANEFSLEQTQRDAWGEEIRILKETLSPNDEGRIHLEFSIPRMGKRIDALLLIGPVVFILEFKVGGQHFTQHDIDQVTDYALDLKNFHETSHNAFVAPILIPTQAPTPSTIQVSASGSDRLLSTILSSEASLGQAIREVLDFVDGEEEIDVDKWEQGRYSPTPTIIEAALALFEGHSVVEILRNDAGEQMTATCNAVADIIRDAKARGEKSICFVTGVPGAGKTLVGLKIATEHTEEDSDLRSVFLSGNGPLVAVLREALTRNRVQSQKDHGVKTTKALAGREVKLFIQNVHNFRDECLKDSDRPPYEHIALFDEAQRAWDMKQTASFMLRKKNTPDFAKSESEFLISCLDRHQDWAVIVCLVGGGQEIHTGEAGIGAWLDAIKQAFGEWNVYISSKLSDSEYAASESLRSVESLPNLVFKDELHLSVSARSFRAEKVSLLVKQLLDLDKDAAGITLTSVDEHYPIVLTRDVHKAKRWLRDQARGTERYGMVVSSQAYRLKPHAIDVKSPMNPIHWFLEGKEDVRSSYYLEDVATEFQVQGLELDWACVTWDADFRYKKEDWDSWSFRGSQWQRIRQPARQNYLKNTYRVLLTRARQGMVIVVPEGEETDQTRKRSYYDGTYKYLREIGFKIL